MNGEKNSMIGIVDKNILHTPFQNAVKHIQELNPDLMRMVGILSL
jgi:hypothetical protein